MNPSNKQLRLRSMAPIKMRDRLSNGTIVVDLEKTFTFPVKMLVIQKVPGQHDKIIISAVVPEDEHLVASKTAA